MKEWAPPPESTWALQRPAQRRVAPRVEGLERQKVRTMQGLVLPRSAHALGQLGLQTVEAPVHGALPCSGHGDLQGGEVPAPASLVHLHYHDKTDDLMDVRSKCADEPINRMTFKIKNIKGFHSLLHLGM